MANNILSRSVVKSYFPSSSPLDQNYVFKLLKKCTLSFSFKYPRDFNVRRNGQVTWPFPPLSFSALLHDI